MQITDVFTAVLKAFSNAAYQPHFTTTLLFQYREMHWKYKGTTEMRIETGFIMMILLLDIEEEHENH